jgi:predicted protein tyrosine phosphatase
MAVTHEVKVKQNQYKNQLALDEKLKDIKKSIDNRKAANEDILEILSDFVAAYPEMRFMQILSIFGLSFDESNDRFYEESEETLEKVNEKYGILTRK